MTARSRTTNREAASTGGASPRFRDLAVQIWPIDKLIPYARNARTHNGSPCGALVLPGESVRHYKLAELFDEAVVFSISTTRAPAARMMTSAPAILNPVLDRGHFSRALLGHF
jgi:hypothetical protein